MNDFTKISSKHNLIEHRRTKGTISFDCSCHNYYFVFDITPDNKDDLILLQILDKIEREIYSNWPGSFALQIRKKNDEKWR